MLKELWSDESAVIISSELVLVTSCAVLPMVVGLMEVTCAVTAELNDFSNAIGALNQTYGATGFGLSFAGTSKVKAFAAGSAYIDSGDDCDTNTSGDIILGAPSNYGWGGG